MHLSFHRHSFLYLLFCALLIAGCASLPYEPSDIGVLPKEGIYHKVQEGETIWRIAKTYDVGLDDIIESNKIPNVAYIEKDQLIFIPGATSAREVIPVVEDEKENEFSWPVKGRVLAYFGEYTRNRTNKGIDIQSVEGEPVLASRAGKVIFADYLPGYSQTVILDHGDSFFTVYSQNSVLLVNIGDSVKKGTAISQVGSNGQLAFLHFEIRKNEIPDNPLYYLP